MNSLGEEAMTAAVIEKVFLNETKEEHRPRSIEQIIEDGRVELAEKRARDRREAANKEAMERAENRRQWEPILEGMKKFIPKELHDFIEIDDRGKPDVYGGYGRLCRKPVRITLPTAEKHTVFGYWFSDEAWGFVAGVARRDDEGEIYFVTAGDWWTRHEHEDLGGTFAIALAETIENYDPPTPRSKAWNPPPTVAEELESLIRGIARAEWVNREE